MKLKIFTFAVYLAFYCASSQAGIIANSTRVIYQASDREQVINLANTNRYPVLIQVWIDDGSADPEFKQAPFVTIPAIFRMDAGEIKSIRMIYNLMSLPQDRESVYWLNLYEVPAVAKSKMDKNYLNLAMNTQMKVFYRPKQLQKLSQEEIVNQLHFSLIPHSSGFALKLQNPTPYHVSLLNLKLINTDEKMETDIISNTMLNPFAQTIYPLQKQNQQHKFKIMMLIIDDLGHSKEFYKDLAH
nr:molecular chaperone [Acinetobacter sp. Marseille-Q1620]